MSHTADTAEEGLAAYAVKDPETFALNMARAVEQAGKAASAWLAPRENGSMADSGRCHPCGDGWRAV